MCMHACVHVCMCACEYMKQYVHVLRVDVRSCVCARLFMRACSRGHLWICAVNVRAHPIYRHAYVHASLIHYDRLSQTFEATARP